jgi:hypothetical protein
MKKVLYLMLCVTVLAYSCKKNDDPNAGLREVKVQLAYPAGSSFGVAANVVVKVNSGTVVYEDSTDANGLATFSLPVGIYELSATDNRSEGGTSYIYNGVKSGVTVTGSWISTDVVTLSLTESKASQVVIKEVFVGGTPKDDGSGAFTYDRYVLLYNNSATPANLDDLCFATVAPYNANATNAYYGTDGELTYKTQGWVPAAQGIWYFQTAVTIEPYKQVVVALTNAVNNTTTYSKSINFDNASYYCMYDVDDFSHAATYASPAASIPTSHYLKAEKYGTGTAWTLSNTSPGLFIFSPQGTTPAAFAANATLTDVLGAYTSKKVPVEWVVDGVDAYLLNNTGNKKRLTPTIDAGYVYHINNQGYSIYRNVDKTATEAIPGNAGKIVYNYQLGTVAVGGTTDPSGIDAEASIKNGAKVVYKDSNNSTNDFHMRSKASLRTN